ncbi:NHL repeat-containing protein [Brevundimonas staleyi]|uniref:NHL repeat-containing protein n=1 Tax=Brevundimonas staleyi TaxID=74326 RepID=A0ABW0FU93_9CAUL
MRHRMRALAIGAALSLGVAQPALAQQPACGSFPLNVTQYLANQVSRVDATGAVTPYFSTGGIDLGGIAMSATGDAYVVESSNPGRVTVNGASFATAGNSLEGAAFDGAGNLLVTSFRTNSVISVAPNGTSTTVINSGLNGVTGIALDAAGNIYVASFTAGEVRAYQPNGALLTTWGTNGVVGGLQFPAGLAFDTDGALFVTELNQARVYRIAPGGGSRSLYLTTQIDAAGLAFDRAGNLYVTGRTLGRIYKVDRAVFTPGGNLTSAGVSTFADVPRASSIAFSSLCTGPARGPARGPDPVPTLSEWAMILLGLLLAGGAALHIERRRTTV